MFRIGEFSKLTQVSIRMLRYYDEVGLFKPAKIEKQTNHRKYSVEQIPTLNKILFLRDSGFNVSEIAEILNIKDDFFINFLDIKYAEIEKTIQDQYKKLQKIQLAKKEIIGCKSERYYNISIKSIPSYQVLSLRKIIPDYYAEGVLWQEILTFATKQHIQLSNDTFSIYHDTEYKETNVDVELCVHVKEKGTNIGNFIYRKTNQVPIMAYTMAYGDFSNISGTFTAFAEWIEKSSHYQTAGATRQIVHRGPWNECNPHKYLIELQIPLQEV